MSKKSINSTLDIVGWFCNKALHNKQQLSAEQLQNMLFLAQMHHVGKEGRVLIPSMFVCYQNGFYEPTIEVILANKLPLLKDPKLDKTTALLLESVWQKYAALSDKELQKFITSLACWQHFYNSEEEVIVNPMEIVSSFTSSISKDKSFNQSKIRISQNGPVQVSPWRPRKLGVSPKSYKKDS